MQRYREVMDAYLTGMEKARQAGHSLSKIHSVASFFVSRVDTEIDKRLDRIGSRQALELRGQAGVANARLAYATYRESSKTAIVIGPSRSTAPGSSARCGLPPA